MKKTKLLFFLALFSAVGMLFFTFFNLGFFSNLNYQGKTGLVFTPEIPIGTEAGLLSTLSDVCYTVAPFALILSLYLCLFSGKKRSRILSALLASLPLLFYALLELIGIVNGDKTHVSCLVTLFFLLLVGGVTLASGKSAALTQLSAYLATLHAALEIVLFCVSLLVKEKLSPFYFFETLPFGKTSVFTVGYLLLSVLFYHLFYAAAIALRGFAITGSSEKEKTVPLMETILENETEPKIVPEEIEIPEDTEEENESGVTLSLEDLGIER